MVGAGGDSNINYAFGVTTTSDIISGNEDFIPQEYVHTNTNDKSTDMVLVVNLPTY